VVKSPEPANGPGRLRASHADREQLVRTLKAAFVQGRLTKDELDERVDRAFASRTYADLADLTTDLPPGLAGAEASPSTRAGGDRPAVPPGRVIAAATTLCAASWAVVPFLSPNGGDNATGAAVIFGGLVVYLGILLVCLSAILTRRQHRRSAGAPPQRPGLGGPGSGYLIHR
jgi:DUF1707 SHOCT-like domain